MKKTVFQVLFFAFLMLGLTTVSAWAQKPLKGSFTFTIQTPSGPVPVPFTFKSNGKGTLSVPTGNLALSYREKGANISVAVEGPGLAPDGSDLTFVIRGTKTDTSVTATAIAITDTADPSSPIGFMAIQLPVSGTRNK